MSGMAAISDNEPQLVREAAAGDTTAFDALVLRHAKPVYRLALRMLGSREDAEDVQQETFFCAYRGLRRFRGDASFGTWVYSIAARLCVTKLRRAARRPEETHAELELASASPDGDPEERLLAVELAGRVQKALAQLSPNDRLLIVLKHVEQLSHGEIAAILDCSVESSRSRLARATRLFREAYERM